MTRAQLGWLLYDPANAAYALVVRTVFAPIFLVWCAGGVWSQTLSTAIWGYAASAAGITAGIISVLAGPSADARRCKLTAFAGFVFTGVFAVAMLLFFDKGDGVPVLALLFVGLLCYMAANSFYDALLVDVAAPSERDRLSSVGYAWGYVGGIVPFLCCLPLSGMLSTPNVCKTAFLIALLWWAAGTVPLLKTVREAGETRPRIPLRVTLKYIFSEHNILLFLVAYFLYIDGVGTILLVATPLATGLSISVPLLLATILGLQFLGFPFTLLYGRLSRRFSARTLIRCAIGVYILIALLAGVMSFTPSLRVRQILFLAIAFLVGTSQGGIQSLSRSLFSRLIPRERAAELFGVYNFFGKFTTVVGPVLVGVATACWNRPELGITMLALPFAAGAWLLGRIRIPAVEKTT